MKVLHHGGLLSLAAAKAGIDEKTARKYRALGLLPSQLASHRHWRTREDVFHEVWPEIEQRLDAEPHLQAVTLFGSLCQRYPDKFKPGNLRTLQRRLKVWRALHGRPKEVFFPQEYSPGQMAQSDFTHMKELNITIAGEFFDHLFYHFVLPYSNWETGSVCFSESFESLSAGLQRALWQVGAVPAEHRTDSLSAAVNKLSSREQFTVAYQGLLAHYRMRASHTSVGRGNENGDVEQAHYRFKQAVAQELLLRGSRDFSNREQYELFLQRLLDRRNAPRCDKLQEELRQMQTLPPTRLEEYSRLPVRVSRNATIRVRNNLYSVNSQLIGERVEVRLFSERLEVWFAEQCVEVMERLRGAGKHHINYRHIIHSLVRKPGAFARYRYQSDLFPRLLFRVAYDALRETHPQTAERQYLKILEMAASVSEERVDEILRLLIEGGEVISEARVKELLETRATESQRCEVVIAAIELQLYDGLLNRQEGEPWQA